MKTLADYPVDKTLLQYYQSFGIYQKPKPKSTLPPEIEGVLEEMEVREKRQMWARYTKPPGLGQTDVRNLCPVCRRPECPFSNPAFSKFFGR